MKFLLRAVTIFAGALLLHPKNQAAEPPPLINITPTAFSPQTTFFIPGVFQLVETTNTIVSRPPSDLPREMAHVPLGIPIYVVAHLGINNDQWAQAQTAENNTSIPATNALKMIGSSATLIPVDKAVRWSFNSASLPPQLKAEVPGGGIYFHIEDRLPQPATPFLFADQNQALLVEAKLRMPQMTQQGSATTTVSLGVGMQTLDTTGKLAPLPLIVGLFNSRAYTREVVGFDGRNLYAGSPLTPKASFIVPIAGQQQSGAWNGPMIFSFKIDRPTITRLITAINKARLQHGLVPLDTHLSSVRLKALDLRNENRFLDKGTIQVMLDTEYLRATRLSN